MLPIPSQSIINRSFEMINLIARCVNTVERFKGAGRGRDAHKVLKMYSETIP
jgi:hypothetical protein